MHRQNSPLHCYVEKLCILDKIFRQDEQDEQDLEMTEQDVFIL
jgi:hypothetical protein